MIPMMRMNNGVGLAAPQIGVFKQYFIMETTDRKIVDFVNPDIYKMYGKEEEDFEACLSLPPTGNGCPVPRLEHISIIASTSKDPQERKETQFSKMNARVAQHEIDHLCGVFFIDRVNEKRRKAVLDLYRNWKAKQGRNHAENSARSLTPHCV